MSEFQAAMGICNLRHIDEKVVEYYRTRLSNIEGIKLCDEQEGVVSNYAYFPVVFDGYKYTRDEVFDRLAKEEIVARKYFYPLTNSFDCYKGCVGFNPDLTPVAKHIADRVLTLPLIIGLGAVAYEMFLYSSLYTWAFLVLIFRGIRGLIEKFGKNKQEKYTTIALGIMLALLLFNNIPWFIEIISYGINTYPVISAGI